MTKLYGTLIAAATAALFAGCPVYGDNGPGGVACVGIGCPCTSIDQCDTGTICSAGRCELGEDCTTDAQCESNQECNELHQVCVDLEACRTNGDCAVGRYCNSSNVCEESSTCTSDASCSGGFVCDFRDTCVPLEGCRVDTDCTGGQICIESVCRSTTTTCRYNYECGAGHFCVDSHCTTNCTDNDQCPADTVCDGNFCRPDTTQCTATSQCSGGQHCVEGNCLDDCEGAPSSCGSNNYCDVADSFCHPNWQPRPVCVEDDDCATGHVCRSGVCRTPCVDMSNTTCMTFDSQLPVCREASGEYLCFSTAESVTPECTRASDCMAAESCVDTVCRND